ncbi:RICIN domain-containing protein [Acrocarpospora sp. B8E8]|uniref:RICIN domain-containing protein n=1 Tax=Acrocarpospora sp. B8E8 TaxID=3153572 RepID=UPI00325E1715
MATRAGCVHGQRGLLAQRVCNKGASQQGRFVAAADGAFTITAGQGDLCLSGSGSSTADSVQLSQATCASGSNQQWRLTRVA